MNLLDRYSRLLLLACSAFFTLPDAQSAIVLSVESVAVPAGSTGNGLNVLISNTGPGTLTVGGFNFQLEVEGLAIDFTSADISTVPEYIFAGNSLFGPVLTASNRGNSIAVSDIYATPNGGRSMTSGSTYGLGRILFDAAFVPGTYAVSFLAGPATSLSSETATAIGIDSLASGVITVNGIGGNAIPEPSTAWMLLGSVPLIWALRRFR